MTRKAVINRIKPIDGQRASIQSLAPTIARRLGQRPAAPQGADLCYQLVLEHMHAELHALGHKLEAAEAVYTAGKAQVDALKRQRDQASAELGQRHRRIKRFLRGFYQPRDLAGAGITGITPTGALELARHVTSVTDFLYRIDQAEPPILGLTFDAPAMAEELEAGVDKLKTAVSNLEGARAAVSLARAEAEAAIAEVDRVSPWIIRCVESLCHLADEQVLARRISSR